MRFFSISEGIEGHISSFFILKSLTSITKKVDTFTENVDDFTEKVDSFREKWFFFNLVEKCILHDDFIFQ